MGNRTPVSPAPPKKSSPDPPVYNPLSATHPNTARAIREQMVLTLLQETNTVPQIYDLVKEHGPPINTLIPTDTDIQNIDIVAKHKKTLWDIYNGRMSHHPVRDIASQLMVWDNRAALVTAHPTTGEPRVFYVHTRHPDTLGPSIPS